MTISLCEKDQFENTRNFQEERTYPIQLDHKFVPGVGKSTSILKLNKYIEVTDVEGVSETKFELGSEDILLDNISEFVGWKHDDKRHVSEALTRIYAQYDGTRYEVDSQIIFRTGNEEKEYALFKTDKETIREFEEGINDCKEVVTTRYYKRADGSQYTEKLPSEKVSTPKPIQVKIVGWSHNNEHHSSMPRMQEYVISGGKELNIGSVKDGANQGHEIIGERDINVGQPIFQNGRMEQKRQHKTVYKRPDGSQYENIKDIASEFMNTQIRIVGWNHNDGAHISTPLIQEYVIREGQELSAPVRNGENQGHESGERGINVGHPVFRNGQLEQQMRREMVYRRPDGSEYSLMIGMASAFMPIPHPVTYNNRTHAWSPNRRVQLPTGTFLKSKRQRGIQRGILVILNGNILTKYQTNGTVVRRQASPAEMAALAPTRKIPCKHWVRHGWDGCRWTDTGDSIEVLPGKFPGNVHIVGIRDGKYNLGLTSCFGQVKSSDFKQLYQKDIAPQTLNTLFQVE